MTPELSVVIPCYNEAASIPELLRRFKGVPVDLELILVDNGSTPGVREEGLPGFARVLRLERNEGYGGGIRAGLASARAGVVGFTHADLQTPPEDLLVAYERYKKLGPGPRLVKGRRTARATRDEAIVSRVYNKLSSALLGLPLVDVNAQPKVFGRDLVQDLLAGPTDMSFDLFVLWKARQRGCRIEEFDVRFEPRVHGGSKWAHRPAARLRMIGACFRRIFEMRGGRSKW